jgi:D-lactate dehydrogenase
LDVYENEREYFFEDRSQSILNDDMLSVLTRMPNVILTGHQVGDG